jgi:NADH-quinone oxidoreductase subunit N
VPGGIAQYFTGLDYLLALPMLLLTLFAMGILLIDLMLPPEWKWQNPLWAFVGVCFATIGVLRIHSWYNAQGQIMGHTAFMNTLVVDRFALYFFYLFLAGTAVAILMSVRYLEIEKENHGEYYALMLFSVVGMMCMAAGFDIVMISN